MGLGTKFTMIQNTNKTEENENLVFDAQKLKALGLKRTTAYIKNSENEEPLKRGGAERQARYRNKQKKIKDTMKDIGLPPADVIQFVKNNSWFKVRESIYLLKKFNNLPRLVQWILRW